MNLIVYRDQQSVGTIVLSATGMTFQTADPELGAVLLQVQADGLLVPRGADDPPGVVTDVWVRVPPTDGAVASLENYLFDHGGFELSEVVAPTYELSWGFHAERPGHA